MSYWYEQAVDEQRQSLGSTRRRLKPRSHRRNLYPMNIEPTGKIHSQGHGDRPEPIKA
jgi:hypothetical protein